MLAAADGTYAFRQNGNIADIAGIVITNTDFGGIGFDNIRFNSLPAPGALPLLVAAGLGAGRRRRR